MADKRVVSILRHVMPIPAAAAVDAQVVLVTGCTSGLGYALCEEFARLGHTVIGCARREDRIESMQQEFGSPHFFCVVDSSDLAGVLAFADRVGNQGLAPGMYRHAAFVWKSDPYCGF